MEPPSPRGDRGSAEMARFRPIRHHCESASRHRSGKRRAGAAAGSCADAASPAEGSLQDRKSTRLNSSHTVISYAVFCLKKKKAALDERPITQIDASLAK